MVLYADMRIVDTFLLAGGAVLVLVSAAAYLYVRLRLGPKQGSQLDDYYYELEDQHPGYAAYGKWLRITFAGVALGVLMVFIAMVL